jgi:hypothetical protein
MHILSKGQAKGIFKGDSDKRIDYLLISSSAHRSNVNGQERSAGDVLKKTFHALNLQLKKLALLPSLFLIQGHSSTLLWMIRLKSTMERKFKTCKVPRATKISNSQL